MKLWELQASYDTLSVADSETIATLLAATTYFLLKSPSKLQILIDEIRTAFTDELEITMSRVNKFKYELALPEEGRRVFPALPGTSARVTGNTGTTICGR